MAQTKLGCYKITYFAIVSQMGSDGCSFVCLFVCVCDPQKSNLEYTTKAHKEEQNNTDIDKGTEEYPKLRDNKTPKFNIGVEIILDNTSTVHRKQANNTDEQDLQPNIERQQRET